MRAPGPRVLCGSLRFTCGRGRPCCPGREPLGGGTPRRGGASALARIRWPEGAKGGASGGNREPHPPPPTWPCRPGEERRSCGGSGGEWAARGRAGGVCATLGDLVWWKERIGLKILGDQMPRLSGVHAPFFDTVRWCCSCGLSTCCVSRCMLGRRARRTGRARLSVWLWARGTKVLLWIW